MTYDEFIAKAEYRKGFEVSATNKALFDFAIQMAEGMKKAKERAWNCDNESNWNGFIVDGYEQAISDIENNIEELSE